MMNGDQSVVGVCDRLCGWWTEGECREGRSGRVEGERKWEKKKAISLKNHAGIDFLWPEVHPFVSLISSTQFSRPISSRSNS